MTTKVTTRKAQEALYEVFMSYVRHDHTCDAPKADCTCGLTKILKAVTEDIDQALEGLK
jgi:hypothetical protein